MRDSGPSLVQVDGGSYECPDDPGEIGYGKGRGARRVSITDEEGMMLSRLVSGVNVLEIGTGLGVATCWMAKTAKQVYTVETDEWVQRTVWPALAQKPNVVTYTSAGGVPEVDAAFIDACHMAESVERDTREAMRHVRAGGLLIFHDTGADAVKEGIARVIPLESVQMFETQHGLGVFRRPTTGEGMKKRTDVSVMVGVPHIANFPGKWVDSWTSLTLPTNCRLKRVWGRPVDVARNLLVKECLEGGFDWLLFIDADMCFAPDSLVRLNSRGKPLISALCFTRRMPPTPTCYRGVQGYTEEGLPYLGIRTTETLDFLEAHQVELDLYNPGIVLPDCPDALKQYDASGAAFVLIHRKVLEAVEPPWFKYSSPERMIGEDFYFYMKAKEAGFPLWVDRTVIVGHCFGDQYIGALDFAAYQQLTDFALPSWVKLFGRWMRRLGVK